MKRWNGWGDTKITVPLPASAATYLAARVGEGCRSPDADYQDVLRSVPASRLEPSAWMNITARISTDPGERLDHACGHSLPDWVALRSGQIPCFPDGVAYPRNPDEVRQIINLAQSRTISLIPYGGGTSVVGHIDPLAGDQPVITMDLSGLTRLLTLDETNRLAIVEAGITGPNLEKELNQRGYTLGHFPQSFEQSTLGGWIATRSCGQQSFYYGRIEDLFAGGHVETPAGSWDLTALPASAAGPDLRQVLLGSEGRLGVITSAAVRVRPLPPFEGFYGLFFHDWADGLAALREIAQEKSNVSMLRLSDTDETQTTMILSGKDQLVGLAERGLEFFGYQAGRCLLVIGLTGEQSGVRFARQRAFEIVRAHGGLLTRLSFSAGAMIGKMWQKSRFSTPYLRNTLWDHGYALDTLETALSWSKVIGAAQEIKQCIGQGLESVGEQVLVFAHLSHVYRDGASLYVTFLFRRSENPQLTLQNWRTLKTCASQVIVQQGGTISHQHGVGRDHSSYLPAEKSPAGMALLNAMLSSLDPHQIMNPGKLVVDELALSNNIQP